MARILLNEADPDVRRLLALLLGRLGHEVTLASPGKEPESVDLMLLEPASRACLDLALRARAAQPTLPIVCVSVLPEEGSALALGPLAYLTKPFALDDLHAAVDAALLQGAAIA
jgi:DNA-binding response OmpR family regulator